MQEQRYEEAAGEFRSALSISHHTDHRLALGMALLKSGNPQEAAIYLRQVLRDRPNDAAVRSALEEAQGRRQAVR
jgi:predicted Zn-dependent protease